MPGKKSLAYGEDGCLSKFAVLKWLDAQYYRPIALSGFPRLTSIALISLPSEWLRIDFLSVWLTNGLYLVSSGMQQIRKPIVITYSRIISGLGNKLIGQS